MAMGLRCGPNSETEAGYFHCVFRTYQPIWLLGEAVKFNHHKLLSQTDNGSIFVGKNMKRQKKKEKKKELNENKLCQTSVYPAEKIKWFERKTVLST